mgnify:FL=1|tara:strand:- start:13076 stop:13786 length:711 start_codon:yes stop_codon:yes gene_type:complete
MAKLGTYSYPDIRFSDAIEISARILNKFKGSIRVKGLAWELGMAENSGTLFAKIAALRDFGLVEGRGELRVSDLAQRIINPANESERLQATSQSFKRVDLLFALYDRFEGEAPDDKTLLVALEEITRADKPEIIKRFTLIQKHLNDASRALSHHTVNFTEAEVSIPTPSLNIPSPLTDTTIIPELGDALILRAGDAKLTAPLSLEYIDIAINLLKAIKLTMPNDDFSFHPDQSNIN